MTPDRAEQPQAQANAPAHLHQGPLSADAPAIHVPVFVEADAAPAHYEAPRSGGGRIAPAIAALLALGWTAFFLVAHRGDWSAAADLRLWPALLAEWSVPMLLIGLGLVIARQGGADRSDYRAEQLGEAAQALGDEAGRLEARLTAVNRELSLAREFVGAQSRDLESLGRIATERLGACGTGLQELVQVNGERIEAIASVSRVAIDNMEQLRAQLPVLASATRDMTNYVGSAGTTAQDHVRELQTALQRLGETGLANEQQVRSLRQAADEAVADFARHGERLAALADARFAALAEHGAGFRAELDAHEAEALAGLRGHAATLHDQGQRIAASLREAEVDALTRWQAAVARIEGDLSGALVLIDNAERDAFAVSHQRLLALSDDAERVDAIREERERGFADALAERRRAAEQVDEQSLALVRRRLAELDAELTARTAAHRGHSEAIAAQTEAVAMRLGESETRLAGIATQGAVARSEIDAHLNALLAALADGRETMAGADGEVRGLIGSAERLLELLRAAGGQARGDLPQALSEGETRIGGLADAVARVLAQLDRAGADSGTMAERMRGDADDLHRRLTAIAGLQRAGSDHAAAQAQAFEGLRQQVETLGHDSDALLARTRGEFTETLRGLSDELSKATGGAFDRAVKAGTAQAAGRIEQAAAHAAGVGGEAAQQLRGELDRVEALTASLETRVEAARERASTSVDRDFARHAAVITDTLNSNAIDIATALDSELPDTAWAAYLRGDRGVFTRRAVRLLDAGQARAIVGLFEQEPAFRDVVTRYIHDFEAMLRELLSAREGHVLAVTLLSSDMGKLYVALAQAIERLRR